MREDFDVREDGKPQRLTDFVFVGGTRAAEPPVTPTSPAAPAPAPEAAPRPGRQIAIVVDEPHLSRRGVGAAKEILRRFVSETVAPDDAIALVVIGAPAATLQLTRDRAALRQAIERIRARADESLEGPGRQMTAAQAELILRGDPAALKLAARLLKQEPGYGADPPANAGPEFQGKGGVAPRDRIKTSDPTPAGIEPEERSAALEVQEQARGILAQALSVSGVSLAALEDVLRGMAPLPGRKLCLLVSDGFLLGRGTREEQTRQLQQVTDAATRSGLAVYALLASGVVPIAPDASMPGSAGPAGLRESVGRASEQVMLEGLRDLADETGGLVLRGSDGIADGLARMLRDTDSLYLLAYEPANRKRDGRFRKIDVRLRNRGDLIVRTRRGYFAPGGSRHVQPGQRAALPAGPRALNLAGPVPLSPAEAQHALATPTPRAGVPVRVAADYVELVPGRPQAVVRAHVDPAGLPWKEVDGRKRAEFDLVGGVYDAGGQPVVSPFVGQHYVLDVTPAEYDKLKETGVRLDAKVFLRPGQLRGPDARPRPGARAARRRRRLDPGPRPHAEEAHAQQRLPLVVGREPGRGARQRSRRGSARRPGAAQVQGE